MRVRHALTLCDFAGKKQIAFDIIINACFKASSKRKNKNVASPSDYNVLSICSGVGGLDLAVQISVYNAVTVCHVERETQAAAVLAARMADGSLDAAPVWSDLSSFGCQPNSVAGTRLGSADDRFLIDQLIRVIDEVRPSRVFRENVTGNADGQLAALIPALEGMGYSVAAGIFSASEVGASHRRERLFIMADSNGGGSGSRGSEQVGQQYIHAGSEENIERKSKLADAKGFIDGRLSKREGKKHARPSLPRGKLANTLHAEPQGQLGGQRQSARREVKNGPTALQSRAGLPYFAPGPSDPRWPEIIKADPRLLPAGSKYDRFRIALGEARFAENGLSIEGRQSDSRAAIAADAALIRETAESYLRGNPNGLASRVDRLRAAGNGVCAMAGAIAWLSLSAHFE